MNAYRVSSPVRRCTIARHTRAEAREATVRRGGIQVEMAAFALIASIAVHIVLADATAATFDMCT